MTRYYSEAGTPPGVWMGSGVAEFGKGQVAPGAEVTPPNWNSYSFTVVIQ